jgi:hypothetical protein
MSSKEDDIRLPFSTIDPVMGDVISLLWEPEILQSMGQTMNILATEVIALSAYADLDPNSIPPSSPRPDRSHGPHELHPMAHDVNKIGLSH